MTTNYREILRLDSLGFNHSQIAEAIPCSRTTVINALKMAREKNIKWPDVSSMSPRDVTRLFAPGSSLSVTYVLPDYDYVYKEMQKKGVTLNLLWIEYCQKCADSREVPYQLTQFKKLYRDYLSEKNVTMHLEHKPGEILQVDWAGDKAYYLDPYTGNKTPAYLFIAALPYSGYSYAEAFHDMKEASWIKAHVNAFSHFGGVTRIIQCDNLKTGVVKHGKDEIVLNKNYSALSEHYNTVIMPTRVRSPRDKALVENTVGKLTTFILAALRNQQFLSLEELNDSVWELLDEFNNNAFQKKEGSRYSMFLEERRFLQPLPQIPYEVCVWKTATVAPNYHISVEKMNYSVPYEYIRRKVDVRITDTVVEVFFNGTRLCSHSKLFGRANQYSTNPDHMPPGHKEYLQWNADRFIRWASTIGENTVTAIKALISSYKIEQQSYKSCLSILKLSDKYSAQRLENACRRALSLTPCPSYKHIQAILASGQDMIPEMSVRPNSSDDRYGFSRGTDQFKGGQLK